MGPSETESDNLLALSSEANHNLLHLIFQQYLLLPLDFSHHQKIFSTLLCLIKMYFICEGWQKAYGYSWSWWKFTFCKEPSRRTWSSLPNGEVSPCSQLHAFQEMIHLSFKCMLERKALHFRDALLRLKKKGVMSYCVPSAQFLTR